VIQPVVRFLRASGMQILAVVIAVALWAQVHGQGTGSISMDVPLQVEGLRPDIAIVNNLPDHLRVTVSGLQARLNELSPSEIRVPLDVSHMTKPGVVDQALEISAIRVPAGLTVTKLQPDHLQVQLENHCQTQRRCAAGLGGAGPERGSSTGGAGRPRGMAGCHARCGCHIGAFAARGRTIPLSGGGGQPVG